MYASLLLILCSISLLLSAIVISYLMGLAAFRCFGSFSAAPKPQELADQEGIHHRIAILIPAHNEEAAIGLTIDSCQQSDYPPDRYQLFVIADNCTDGTAQVVRQKGITCLERNDEEKRGKGHALAWAFPRLSEYPWDAVMVVDADCNLHPQALNAVNAELRSGSPVLQINYVASNPDDSSISFALALANTLENDLFYAPKSALELAVFLRGTGFVLHRKILERFPWDAHSIVEDAEYTARLLAHDISVKFLPEVSVRSEFPIDAAQMAVQRSRWVGGGARWAATHGFKCMWQGLRYRSLRLLDAGWTSFVTIRALVLLQLGLSTALTVLCLFQTSEWGAVSLLIILSVVLTMHAMYVGVGFMYLGITARRLALFAGLPFVTARHMVISLGAVICGPKVWKRTPRSAVRVACEQ